MTIQWKQIWSLAALDLAILISWIAYHKYQPVLVAQFGFSDFVLPLLIAQGLILALTPPIAGRIADKMRKKGGNRLPMVNLGITLTAMVFMAVAATIFANPGGLLRWVFPLLVVIWLVSMNIFHSPALSTLELFVPANRLPGIMAIFAILADMTAAIEPSIVDIIDYFGAPLTFAAGGVLVFGAGYWFMRTLKQISPQQEENIKKDDLPTSNFPLVFILGLGLGTGILFFFELFPAWLSEDLPFLRDGSFNPNYFASLMIVFAAALSFPLSKIAERGDLQKIGFGALAIMLLGGLIAWQVSGYASLIGYVIFPAGFAMVSVTFLPLAFVKLRAEHSVFGIGLFFSGAELPNSIADVIQVM